MAILVIVNLLVISSLFGFAVAIQDYCSDNNTYATVGSFMQFTREPSVREFALRGKFKGLHCCAKGYRSIEWYKDGKPYPWSSTESQLILYPENANQTVYAQAVTLADAGNYTCLLRNDSIVRSHTIQLTVFEKSPDDPQVTYLSPYTEAAIGQNLRLFCEAFGGSVDLPDARYDAVWRKAGHNGSIDDEPHITQKNCSREDGQTFGTYLVINKVKRNDFGEYVCTITIPGKSIERMVALQEKTPEVEYLNPNPVPIGKILLIMSAVLFLILTVVILNLQYGLTLRVRFKDSFGPLEENDAKTTDILILYAGSDSELALGVLLPTLETKYGYKCAAKQLSPNVTYWFGELQSEAVKSRRIVALISPALVNDKWNANAVHQAIKQLQALGPQLTCVALKELPSNERQVKNSQGETLSSLARAVSLVEWQRGDERFWLGLRLRLPPKRGGALMIKDLRDSTQGGLVCSTSRLTITADSDSDQGFDHYLV